MKILVTGGCGFIGSHVVDYYVKNGYEVVVADQTKKNNISYANKSAKYVQIDLTDQKAVNSLLQKENPSCINHHAANISLSKSITEPLFDAKNNITAIINILEAMKNNSIPKIIFASSAGALYSQDIKLPFTEKTPTIPISPYGVSKLSSEKYIEVYSKLYNIKYVILRYSNVYGPRQKDHHGAIVPTLIHRISLNKPVTIFNDGQQTRDFLFVGDVALANLLATNYPKNDIFNISSQTETTILKLNSTIESILKKKAHIMFKKKTVAEQKRSFISNKKANLKLKWKSKSSLHSGLSETVRWYENIKTL